MREDQIAAAKEQFESLLREQLLRQERMARCAESRDFAGAERIVIGLIDGDGIGPVIMAQARRAAEKLLAEEISSGRVELREISGICRANGLPLYVDGARLAYALACPENDVALSDLAALCDAFYIGGTKCGALFGEALVIPKHDFIPHLFTIIKQHGALLAKGRIAGLQFDTLFTGSLYDEIGKSAIEAAARIRSALLEKGYTLAFPSPTNQIFITLEKEQATRLSEKIEMSFWENTDDGHTIMRIATSWATRKEDVDRLIEAL